MPDPVSAAMLPVMSADADAGMQVRMDSSLKGRLKVPPAKLDI